MLDILIISLVVLFLWWYKKTIWIYPDNFPPGPRLPLPVFGDAWRFGKEIPTALEKLHNKHGPIIGFSLAGNRTVSISDFNMLQELLSKDVHSGRAFMAGSNLARGGLVDNFNPGLIFGSGKKFMDMRRFALRCIFII
jgi:hypothetical protein